MKTKETIIDILLRNRSQFEFLGCVNCRIRWKDDKAEQDDRIAISLILEDEDEDEYFVYSAAFDDLIQELQDDSLEFDIIEIY